MSTYEKELGVVAGDSDSSRVAMYQVGEPGEVPTLEFRMQRKGQGDLGWVTHKRIRLAAGQIGDVRTALNLMDVDAREADIDHTSDDVSEVLEVVADDAVQQSG